MTKYEEALDKIVCRLSGCYRYYNWLHITEDEIEGEVVESLALLMQLVAQDAMMHQDASLEDDALFNQRIEDDVAAEMRELEGFDD